MTSSLATLIPLAISPSSCHNGTVLLCAGDELPTLQRLAVRLTAAVSSAGASERSWSAYGFIHSRKRNKLTKERAEDLVYVFTNLRLAKKFSEPHKFAEWVQEWASSDEEEELVSYEEVEREIEDEE